MKVTRKFFLAAILTVTAGVAGLKSANAATYDWNFTPGADGVLPSSVTITSGSPPLPAVATEMRTGSASIPIRPAIMRSGALL